MTTDPSFAEQYGPWALVLGASEGVGAAFAQQAAARGLHMVLVARRQEALETLARDIEGTYGVDTISLALDLTVPDAAARVIESTAHVPIGTLVYCAGADVAHSPFHDQPLDHALALVQRNCVVPLQLCHHFGALMRTRGRGGIVTLSSGAGLVGGPNMVAYGATKAFDIVMTESLWAELSPHGVHVLSLVLGATDTPAFRRHLTSRGLLADPDDPAPLQGIATVDEVVADLFANLGTQPTHFAGERMRESAARLGAMNRSDAVRAMAQAAGGTMHTQHRTGP